MIRCALPLLLILPLAACGGSAQAATHRYSVTSFTRVRVAGPFDVNVHVGGPAGVVANGPQEAIDRLSVEQDGDTLVLKPLPGGWGGWPGGFHGKLVVDVSTPSLVQAVASGSGNTSVDRVRGDALDVALSGSGSLSVGAVEVTRLGAVMTGSGDLSVAGRARAAKATLTGSGDLKGGGLSSDDAEVGLVGSGNLTLGVRHVAKVNLSGSGDIAIVGPANCLISRSGSGDVRCDHPSGQ